MSKYLTLSSGKAISQAISESDVTNLVSDLASKVAGASNLTTTGSVPYVSASGTLNQDSNFFWNSSTHSLGIGTATPASPIEISAIQNTGTFTAAAAGSRMLGHINLQSTDGFATQKAGRITFSGMYTASLPSTYGAIQGYKDNNSSGVSGGGLQFLVGKNSDGSMNMALTIAQDQSATFAGTITATNFSGSSSGTNSGDITLAAVGSSANANAASLSGQVLNLQPFSSSFPGVVPASGGGTTNFLRADGTWAVAGSGTVSTVSVVSANGFAGTVATATTTPAITLSTTITGILQGNGTAISAATTTGSGSVVLATSPSLTTPAIGAATGSSLSVTGQLTSTVATGTAPLVVSSTTQVANLNAATAGVAPAGTLTGTTLNSTVVTSSLTSVGTLASLTVTGNINNTALTASQAVVTDASKNLTSLAYGSTNVNSTLVERDSSGNFSASTITAALTGTASGNTTYTANQYGVVLSGSANAMSVLTPDASTSKVLVSGGTSANPSWSLLTNSNLSGSAAITNGNLAAMASSSSGQIGTVKGNISGSSTTPSDLVLSAQNTPSSVVYRDSNGDFIATLITATTFDTNAASFSGSTIQVSSPNTNLVLEPNGTGYTVIGNSNNSGVYPTPTTIGLAIGQNFAGGSEIDYFNTNTAATITHSFYQQLSSASATLLMKLDPTNGMTLSIALAVASGGSGLATLTSHAVLVGNGTSAITRVSPSATTGVALISNGSSADPSFGQLNLASSSAVTGILANANTTATSANTASAIVARDGSNNFSAGTITAALTGTASGNTTYTANQYGVVLSGSTNAMSVLAPNSSTAFPLVSGGTSANPSWALLTPAGGGTGTATAFTAGSVVFAGTSGVYTQNNSGIFWDNTDGFLGVGTATPATQIEISATQGTGTFTAPAAGTRMLGHINLQSTDSYSTQKGGRITFSGLYTAGGLPSTYGAIQGYKDTNVSGSSGGGLKFLTGADATGSVTTVLTLDQVGNATFTGTVSNSVANTVNAFDFVSGTGTLTYAAFSSTSFLQDQQALTIGTTSATSLTLRTNGASALTINSSQVATFAAQLIGGGTTTNDDASAGQIGEFLTVNSPTGGTATPAASGSYANVASRTLTPGDWDVEGIVNISTGGTFVGTGYAVAISTSTAAADSSSSGGYVLMNGSANFIPANSGLYINTGTRRIKVSNAGNITIYLVAALVYTTLGSTTYGTDSYLRARRVR